VAEGQSNEHPDARLSDDAKSREKAMSDSFIIKVGDAVVCVDSRMKIPTPWQSLQVQDRLVEGRVYVVSGIVWLYGEKGLHLLDMDHRPTDGYRATRFRKIMPASIVSEQVSLDALLLNDA
jgi:hypothetical protein